MGAQSLRCWGRPRPPRAVWGPDARTPFAAVPAAGQGVEGTDPPFWTGQGFPTADGGVGNGDFTPCRRPTGKTELGVEGDPDSRPPVTGEAASAHPQRGWIFQAFPSQGQEHQLGVRGQDRVPEGPGEG